MPYNRRRKRITRRRKLRGVRVYGAASRIVSAKGLTFRKTSIAPLPVVLPNTYVCKLRYAAEKSISPGAAAVVHDFNANGLYDPDHSGVGHQPLGFDQLCLFYKSFAVIGARIKITPLVGDGGLNGQGYAWGIATVSAANAYNGQSLEYIMEQEGVNRTARAWGLNNVFGRHNIAVRKFSTKKHFGVKSIDDDLKCTASADPTKEAWFEVWAVQTGASAMTPFTYLVQIQYIVKCMEPKALAQS